MCKDCERFKDPKYKYYQFCPICGSKLNPDTPVFVPAVSVYEYDMKNAYRVAPVFINSREEQYYDKR